MPETRKRVWKRAARTGKLTGMKVLMSMIGLLRRFHDAAVSIYLFICPVPPGNPVLFARFDAPEPPTAWRDRISQIVAFALLGLPLLAAIPFLTAALPSTGRVITTVYLGSVLWFLASVDIAAKRQMVEGLENFDRNTV